MIKEFTGKHRFLSNFAPCQVEFGGQIYPTVEHAYQAAKSENEEYRNIVRKARTPGDAKRLGRHAQLIKNWDNTRIEVMKYLLRQKFNTAVYKEALLATGVQELVEGNAWGDTFWGVCNGRGENNLGKILMKIRSEIRAD